MKEKPVYQCLQCDGPVDEGTSLCPICGAVYEISSDKLLQTGQTCFECGTQNEMSGKSCPSCGENYSIECPSCEIRFLVGEKVCLNCGYELLNEYQKSKDQARENAQYKIQKNPGEIFFKAVAMLIALAGYVLIVDHLDWRGPQAVLGVLLFLGVIVVVYLILGSGKTGGRLQKKNREIYDPEKIGRLTLIYRSPDLAKAEQLAALIEGEGIPVFIYNAHVGNLLPVSPISEIKVMVPTDRAEEVEQMLTAFGFENQNEDEDKANDLPQS